ncbi:hypothetical protein KPATCC21470_1000 [Kitasatospora purpeofusca]
MDCARRLSCHLPQSTERENIRESTREGLDTASPKGTYGGRSPVITDDLLPLSLVPIPRATAAAPVAVELRRGRRRPGLSVAGTGWERAVAANR